MESQNWIELSNQQLLDELKKTKSSKSTNAVIVGFLVGIMMYSAVKNGFGLFTFFPLVIAYFFVKKLKDNAVLENEIKNELEKRNA